MKKQNLITAFIAAIIMTGCNPNIPPIQTIEPSETAFLVPLEGATSNQGAFNSESFLENSRVATKRVTIPQRWRVTGGMPWSGEWIPTVRLIVVNRKAEARLWKTVTAESKESIGFSSGIASTAQINESDATKFLYLYNNKPLSEVMDGEVLNRVRAKFVEECSRYNLSDLLIHKGDIMRAVRADVEPYFKGRGVNITSLGLAGELTYLEKENQEAINKKFQASQELVAQQAINEKVVSKAKADALAAQILNNPNALKLKQLEMQSRFFDKWDGVMPKVVGSGGIMLSADSLMNQAKK
jgi:hypothetical protein